jgi:prepilin-type N-terminal cleavage/methylation domain-containing protein
VPQSPRRGFTLVELLVTLGVVAVLMAIGFPKVREALVKSQVRAARSSVMTLYNSARARAVRDGRSMTLHFNTTSTWVTGQPRRVDASSQPCTCDTVGVVQNLATIYGVALNATPASFRVDARGLGVQAFTSGTQVIITRGSARDSILISGYGRVSK